MHNGVHSIIIWNSNTQFSHLILLVCTYANFNFWWMYNSIFFSTFPVSSFFSSIGNVPKIRFYSSRSKSKISSKINIFWEKKKFFEQDSSKIKCSVKRFCFLICLKTLILQPFVVFIVLIFTNLTHYVKSTSQNFF